ncbi:mannitol dehydrogenase family protein [Oerskovia flava]|uniref:mannitol dehydrogenase family protein n=1 Tax=Oerskovia flava TaxID=2986422 RepID=UPI00223EF5DA|nr:mannitol dehydrogenase family protein [Oerskovia sp. JB1-3-2]
MTRLGARTVDQAREGVATPRYDRDAVRVGIVHLGVGGFHRAHQARYVDDVLAAGDPDWGICGVGLLPGDAAAAAVAAAQDGLYTHVTVDPDGAETARVVGAVVRYLYGPADQSAVQRVLRAPTTRIVTMTVTEGGYGVDDSTGLFSPRDPATLADLEYLPAGVEPTSALGHLVLALRARRDAGTPPFTVVSCDNIQGNGHVARTALTSFARAFDADLARWIEAEVAFPSSMVDRITPVPTERSRARAAELVGLEDRWAVTSESFQQWVLEDTFTLGRPDLGAVGVELVDDVEPFERMKLRLLNAAHQALGHLGLLAGFSWVHEASRDETLAGFLRRYWSTEAIPTLGQVPGTDLEAYCDQLLARFRSDAVGDTLDRQVVDASERLPKFLVPVLREQLRTGGPTDCCVLVIAAWSLRLEPAEDPVPDQHADALRAAVRREAQEPGALLSFAPTFGDLGQDERLVSAYTAAREALASRGAADVVDRLTARSA